MQRKALFNTKERPSRLEKGVPLFLVLLFQLTRHSLATPRLYTILYANNSVYSPSPFGEGTGVRLLLSPWGRLGGVVPFGEGTGVRLFFSLGGGWVGFPCYYVLLSKTSATPPVFLCYFVFKNLLLCLQTTILCLPLQPKQETNTL